LRASSGDRPERHDADRARVEAKSVNQVIAGKSGTRLRDDILFRE
jgi:hypothetical protein